MQRYLSLLIPEGTAGSNVHISIRLRKLVNKELGFFERMRLKKDITRRLAVYDQAFSFVERHGFAHNWPTEPVGLTQGDWEYMKGLNCQQYFKLEQLQTVLTPWVDTRNLLYVTMRRSGVSSVSLTAM